MPTFADALPGKSRLAVLLEHFATMRACIGIVARVPAQHRYHGHGLGARGSGQCRDESFGARYPHAMAKTHEHVQFAALPFRFGSGGRPQVLLMTSRETRRWIIPKGWPIRGLKPPEVAAREAFE